ncbi:penicillin-binding protein activator [Sedimentitalea nanhaiensis]|uniref:Amino acid/amide ABC transporter substrate-binding protein, HAAT family n=1 Tax=Sedimentitalea nanhaiensis TaxID=999627 RepID=A0A1I6XGI9_9RHOB|nr:penicillin-binding protein activator [Sedimentitalea nanhaiensis]SFT37449.1 amino acid/amide ABC transporter substrate-binding protein, HAAT family [Sedimentitalea nanhaiensis]
MFAVFSTPRKVALYFMALVSLLVLSACDTLPGGGGPTINTNAPVPVALLVPRSSAQSGDSVLAQSLENAARLAIADLGGTVQIDLRVYDTGGNASTAAAQATQAVNDGARIILGPVYAESANAVGLAVRGQNVNVLSFSNNASIAGGNVFVLGPTFDNSAERLTQFAARQGKRSIVLVHGTDLSGQLGAAAIQRAISGSSARLAGTVAYDLSQQAVIGAVPRIKSAVESSGADSIFLTSTTAGALPLFTQLLPESGVSPATTQYIGLTRWDIPSQTLALPGAQGGWFALPDPSRSQQFVSRYSAAYGAAPHPIGGLAYDGIAAIGALVGAGKSDALTGAALTQGAGFQGVNGIFRLRPDGTNQRGLAVATIQNKQVVVIDPAPTSFSGAGF